MIYLITNRGLSKSDEDYFYKIRKAVNSGISFIILREKDLDDEAVIKYAKNISEIIQDRECELIINSNLKAYKKIKPYGLHLSFKMFLEYKKSKDEIVGVSVHSLEEAIKADKLGASYILASNIFETSCKKGLKGKGLNFIKDIKENINCKLIALGGIDLTNKGEVYKAGADGVAIMSYFMK